MVFHRAVNTNIIRTLKLRLATAGIIDCSLHYFKQLSASTFMVRALCGRTERCDNEY